MTHSRNIKLKFPLLLNKKTRFIFFAASCLLFLLTCILISTYRPYIYQYSINDYHFADTCTNILAVPTASCFCISINKQLNYNIYLYVSCICIGFILYEFIGFTYDIFDIIATILSAIPTTILLEVILKKTKLYQLDSYE
jgi:hypothetical protein